MSQNTNTEETCLSNHQMQIARRVNSQWMMLGASLNIPAYEILSISNATSEVDKAYELVKKVDFEILYPRLIENQCFEARKYMEKNNLQGQHNLEIQQQKQKQAKKQLEQNQLQERLRQEREQQKQQHQQQLLIQWQQQRQRQQLEQLEQQEQEQKRRRLQEQNIENVCTGQIYLNLNQVSMLGMNLTEDWRRLSLKLGIQAYRAIMLCKEDPAFGLAQVFYHNKIPIQKIYDACRSLHMEYPCAYLKTLSNVVEPVTPVHEAVAEAHEVTDLELLDFIAPRITSIPQLLENILSALGMTKQEAMVEYTKKC